jgi:NitT/TauT family transport system permease protein
MTRRLRRIVMFVVAMLLVAALWEGYKAIGPAKGGDLLGFGILPRTNDQVMPHVWDMVTRLFDPAQRTGDQTVLSVVLGGAWYSFRIALVGFVAGVAFGMALAVLLTRFRLAERAILPYLVISQTVPLIALAPLVAGWGGKLQIGDWVWPKWMSAAMLGAFLAFFPVAVGTLRGLKSPNAASLELMDSLAAPWWRTLVMLRFPSAVPYIVPALKLGGAGSVVGVVVAEISTGLKGGIGRLIIEYSRQATSDPTKVFTSIFGAALLGLTMAAIVAAIDLALMRNRPKEATS